MQARETTATNGDRLLQSDLLLDENSHWLELGLWAGWEMYSAWGGAPAAGVVCGIGSISGRRHVVIANDALAKEYGLGAMPMSVLIDRNGRIADSHSGVVDQSAWEAEIRKLLDERQ